MSELFVGITTWNDEIFLPHCLKALSDTLRDVDYHICIADNDSKDNTLTIARQYTSDIRVKCETQPNALNYLVSRSTAKHTLLMHSDVIMLHPLWYKCCRNFLDKGHVLVSPEDIGLGNYQRTYGVGMPESSFMLFDTAWLKKARRFKPKRVLRRILGRRKYIYGFDFYGAHVTHNIPDVINKSGCDWAMMKVHPSKLHCNAVHVESDSDWLKDPAFRTYGYGNFYSLDGIVTHYHNWFARWESQFGVGQSKWGIPAQMIKSYSLRFLKDYTNGCVEYPEGFGEF